MKKLLLFIALTIFGLGLNAQHRSTFDHNFGTNGTFRFSPSNHQNYLEKVLVQEDGKIITVGRSRTDGENYAIYVSRHNADGTLDETYGEGGISFFKANPTVYMNGAKDAVLSDDGLIYIAGWTYDYENNTSFILCLDENGFEYPGFGDEGWAITSKGGGIVYEAIDVDSEGDVVVAGYLNDQLLVRRYTADGELDVTFGNNGTVNDTVFNSVFSFGYDVKILEDGKIVVVGSKYDVWYDDFIIQKAYMCRLNTDGSFDDTFGENGIVSLKAGEYAEFALGVEVDTLGNYLVTGHSEINPESTLPRYESFITRVTKEGVIDTSFGEDSDGFVRFEAFEGDSCVNSQDAPCIVAPDGQIFGTFYSYNHIDLSSCAFVYNLDANGKLKKTYTYTGLLAINLLSTDIEIKTMSIALQNDGKLIVGGYASYYDGELINPSYIFISRILTDMIITEPTKYNYRVSSVYSEDGAEKFDYNYSDIIGTNIVSINITDTINMSEEIDSLSYDENGNITKIATWCKVEDEWFYIRYVEYTYNENNLRISRKNYNNFDTGWELGGTYYYNYDENGNMTDWTLEFFVDEYQKGIIEYNEYGLKASELIQQYNFKTNNLENSYLTEYEYDYNGNLIRENESYFNQELLVLFHIRNYEYDELGNCILEEFLNHSNNSIYERKIYKYDTSISIENVFHYKNTESDFPKLPQMNNMLKSFEHYTENEKGELVMANYIFEYEEPKHLETPENLVANVLSTSSISLSWNEVENALSYNVYQADELIANVEETTFTVDSLEYNTEYCYTVTAVRNETETDKSEEVCAKTLGESINELLSSSINIYPNPVEDELFLATEVRVEEIAIYDVYGRQTMSLQVNETTSQQVVEVADLEAGVYFVKVVTNAGEIVKRFVKK